MSQKPRSSIEERMKEVPMRSVTSDRHRTLPSTWVSVTAPSGVWVSGLEVVGYRAHSFEPCWPKCRPHRTPASTWPHVFRRGGAAIGDSQHVRVLKSFLVQARAGCSFRRFSFVVSCCHNSCQQNVPLLRRARSVEPVASTKPSHPYLVEQPWRRPDQRTASSRRC